ncbi:MAG: HEAT repeat domain-containing protein, partial [Candidatus Hermodarchaeota archaeon]
MSSDIGFSLDKINEMEPQEAFKALLSIVSTSNNINKKAKAIDFLIKTQYNDNFQEIKKIYEKESHSEVKIKLIRLFTEKYKKKCISLLKNQYTHEKDWKVRKTIVEAIGKLDKHNSASFLIDGLGDSNIDVKKSAIFSLEGVTDALESLIEVLKFRNLDFYDILINTIVKTSKNVDIQRILNYLYDDNLNIKKNIPILLEKLENKEAVDPLIELLDDKNSMVRINSIKALEKIIPS